MRSALPAIRAALEDHYALPVTGIGRRWSGHHRGPCPCREARRGLARQDVPAAWRLHLGTAQHRRHPGVGPGGNPHGHPATHDASGAWIHRQPGPALSAWEWVDRQTAGILTVAQSQAAGHTLAHLHRLLDEYELPVLRVNQEHCRTTPTEAITGQRWRAGVPPPRYQRHRMPQRHSNDEPGNARLRVDG